MEICNTKKNIRTSTTKKGFEKDTIIDIGAYVLMPNHFHILAREKIENGISLYLLKLLTAYSMYFNKKYNRTGRLYEGTFKSSYVSNDQYLKYLYAYIHLNPAKLIDKNWKERRTKLTSELLKFISEYKYSSLQEYLKVKTPTIKRNILEPNSFPLYFKNFSEHKNELFDWLKIQGLPLD
jgi:putative transposase